MHEPVPAPVEETTLDIEAGDGHRFSLIRFTPSRPDAALYWLPALGVAARSYRPFARTLAERGLAVFLHEWRGCGTSNLRASRSVDWGYRELLAEDIATAWSRSREALPATRWLIGGHSLGAQLAALALARQPRAAQALLLIAGGAPYWKHYPLHTRFLLPAAFVLFRALGALAGYYPGRRLGFAGNEARGMIRDWSRSGWTGDYRPDGMTDELEPALAHLDHPVLTVRMTEDWFVPRPSLQWLLDKMPAAAETRMEPGPEDFSERRADHFGWMKEPAPVADPVIDWLARLPADPA